MKNKCSLRIKSSNFIDKGIPEDKWVETCILVDKLEKVPVESLSEDMEKIGLEKGAVVKLLEYLKVLFVNC